MDNEPRNADERGRGARFWLVVACCWMVWGGLYAIQDVKQAPAADDRWFLVEVRVAGKHVTVRVDGKITADYVEPEGVEREGGLAGRLLDRGTFALQCHDPGSEVWYKAIAVRPLPE